MITSTVDDWPTDPRERRDYLARFGYEATTCLQCGFVGALACGDKGSPNFQRALNGGYVGMPQWCGICGARGSMRRDEAGEWVLVATKPMTRPQ